MSDIYLEMQEKRLFIYVVYVKRKKLNKIPI